VRIYNKNVHLHHLSFVLGDIITFIIDDGH